MAQKAKRPADRTGARLNLLWCNGSAFIRLTDSRHARPIARAALMNRINELPERQFKALEKFLDEHFFPEL